MTRLHYGFCAAVLAALLVGCPDPGQPVPSTKRAEQTVDAESGVVFLLFTSDDPRSQAARTALKDLQRHLGSDASTLTLDAGQHPELAARFNVKSTPVVLALVDGEEHDRYLGDFRPAEFREWSLAALPSPPVERLELAVVTDETFAAEVLDSEQPVLVDFAADWCNPCRLLKPELEAVAAEFASTVKVVQVDVDANRNTVARYRISALPTLLLIDGGEDIAKWTGLADRATLADWLRESLERPR